MSYADYLPKRVVSGKCSRLDDDGGRCRKKACREVFIFENPEHLDAWYAVRLCKKHAEETAGRNP